MVGIAGRSVADAEEAVFPVLPTMMLGEAWLDSHDRERVPGLVAPDALRNPHRFRGLLRIHDRGQLAINSHPLPTGHAGRERRILTRVRSTP
jgi:hypothetical protein